MAKTKIEKRACRSCGNEFPKDKAQCPACKSWQFGGGEIRDPTISLAQVKLLPRTRRKRLETGMWDICFGGAFPPYGITTSSVTLLGGAPGAGKSTMALQLANQIAESSSREVVYVASEEGEFDILERAERLECENLERIGIFPMGTDADLGEVLQKRKPAAVIIDSLSGIVGTDHNEGVKLCSTMKTFAVLLDSPFIIIDHINKQGDFAGFMSLQHAVDTTITLFAIEQDVRQFTTIKNRFGPANKTAEFMMTEKGLVFLEFICTDSGEEDEENNGEEDEADE